MNLSLFTYVPFVPPDLPDKDDRPRKPAKWRRYIPLALTVHLCALKLAGHGIPLWLCLLPWLLVEYAALFVIASAIVFCVAFLAAYMAIAIRHAVTGEGE